MDHGPRHGRLARDSSADETIYNTTYWNATTTGIALPSNFTGSVVDLGPGITVHEPHARYTSHERACVARRLGVAGQRLNLSVLMQGSLLFDTANAERTRPCICNGPGPSGFNVTSFFVGERSFRLQSGAAVGFDGSGFPSGLTYRLLRSDSSGTTGVLNAQTTAGGVLAFTIPAGYPFELHLEGGRDAARDDVPRFPALTATTMVRIPGAFTLSADG